MCKLCDGFISPAYAHRATLFTLVPTLLSGGSWGVPTRLGLVPGRAYLVQGRLCIVPGRLVPGPGRLGSVLPRFDSVLGDSRVRIKMFISEFTFLVWSMIYLPSHVALVS